MEEHMRMMERRRIATLWCHFANIILGLWVVTAPFIFGYLDIGPNDFNLPRLAAERDLPEVATRNLLMMWSDIVSGTLIVLFSVLSLARYSWSQWANAAMGTCASGAAAAGSVIAGLLVIGLSIPRGQIRNRYAGWNRLLF
jgi:hypothetical protein